MPLGVGMDAHGRSHIEWCQSLRVSQNRLAGRRQLISSLLPMVCGLVCCIVVIYAIGADATNVAALVARRSKRAVSPIFLPWRLEGVMRVRGESKLSDPNHGFRYLFRTRYPLSNLSGLNPYPTPKRVRKAHPYA